jgi:transmembrane protein EpsG
MTLTNYWWLLIWLFGAGVCLSIVCPKYTVDFYGHTEQRWGWASAIILAIPYVIWAGFRLDTWGDTSAYRIMFQSAATTFGELPEYVASATKDKGFYAIVVLFKTFISQSDIVFFLVLAAVQMLAIVYVYRKYSCDFLFSIFLFVASADYLSWMHNGIRQFIAVSIIFACLPLLEKKKYVRVIIIVLLASLIHASALLFLPFVFIINGKAWNRRTVFFLFAVVLSVLFLEQFAGIITDAMESTQYSSEVTQFVNDTGVNLLRVLFYSIPAIMSLAFRNRLSTENNTVINICINLSAVTSGFYVIGFFTSGLLAGRVPILFSLSNYILLPYMIKTVFTEQSARLVKIGFVLLYLAYFYYQVFITWGL